MADAPSLMKEFLSRTSGQNPITKLLIANNGMAAVKAIRSIRKWSYETFNNDHTVAFTVMATPEDLHVNAEYIRMADMCVEVPGGSSNNNYANVDLIVDVAAVYVGWGFASENPCLPDKLKLHGIIFIGPPASAMRSLGDKIASTIVAQSANVPCVSWSGSGITETLLDDNGYVAVSESSFRAATTLDVNQGLEHAERIGYPVMIKASEGGGGKGIRLVENSNEFCMKFEQVAREIPGSPIFIMKVVRNARHLEVQLLADMYGNAIALFGRDCSVQRRHQKILEEAPVSIADAVNIAEMEKAAVRLAKLVGYVSAGTVEYLYEPTSKEFFFLELNPRLQVEHPTTEMVSGVNIPAAQLQIAMGIPLNCIKDIRILYGLTPTGTSDIDFEFIKQDSYQIQRKPSPKGHVIAARITAENPEAGFKPNSGKVLELNFRSNSNVWGYFSVNSSGGVHEYADSQFGHVFSYGETRNDARRNLIIALKELSIRGDFRTTVEFLVKLLESEMYVNNTFTTDWLDALITKKIDTEKPDLILAAICGGVSKGYSAITSKFEDFKSAYERGQTPSKTLLDTSSNVDFIYSNIRFQMTVHLSGSNTYALLFNGSKIVIDLKALADGGLLMLIDGKTHLVYTKDEAHATFMTIDGKSCLLEKENDPTLLRSPSPGKLVRYLTEDGAHINSGDVFAEIEVMKMYMPLVSSESGKITFLKPVGSSLASGDTIGKLVLDDPSRVKNAIIFDGILPAFGPPQFIGDKAHQKYRSLFHDVENILNGYEYTGNMSSLLRRFFESLRHPDLPIEESLEILSSLSGRIPSKLDFLLHEELEMARSLTFPSTDLMAHIEECRKTLPIDEFDQLNARIEPLLKIIGLYKFGQQIYERNIIIDLLEKYLSVAEIFKEGHEENVLLMLREKYKGDINAAIILIRSHTKARSRNELILSLLDHIQSENPGEHIKESLIPLCSRLADLEGHPYEKVALKAREMLIYFRLPTYEERYAKKMAILSSVVSQDQGAYSFNYMPLSSIITANYSILDVLPSFFYHEQIGIRAAAFYTYVLHTHQAYSVTSIKHNLATTPINFEWQFMIRQASNESSQSGSISPLSSNKFGSFSDLATNVFDFKSVRTGKICAFSSTSDLIQSLGSVIDSFNDCGKNNSSSASGISRRSSSNVMNVLNIALRPDAFDSGVLLTDEKAHSFFAQTIKSFVSNLRSKRVRRITFMVIRETQFPRYFTFKEQVDYTEDQVIRHVEPAMAYQLELQRLQNFEIKPCFIDNRRLQIYHAVGKNNPADMRFFVRSLVYPGFRMVGEQSTHEFLISEGNRIITDILDALEIVSTKYPNTDCNHLFINFIPTFQLDLSALRQTLKDIIERHRKRLWRYRVTNAEVRFIRQVSSGTAKPIRYVLSSTSGFVIKIEEYQEMRDATGVQKLISLISPPGKLHQHPVSSLYPLKENIQPKRFKAHLLNTTYVYDFPELFLRALEKSWVKYQDNQGTPPTNILSATELIVNEAGELEETDREPGSNTIGMVAWKMVLSTPEYPEGRSLVVIANDVTFNVGSFGPLEDKLFFLASKYSRERGARVGLADEVKSRFLVAWVDPENPAKGFKYLYLNEESYDLLVRNTKTPSVNAEEIFDEGEVRYKIVDIIGRVNGLGVENLQGSGLIAGETSHAYNEIFTITLVTCRSVGKSLLIQGIGAYLVRLGQRTIQVKYTPIILTGAGALNKVLGRQVYTSNLQLGGTQIMYKNGVSHLVAEDDMDGVSEILHWLSYVPKSRDSLLPILPSTDSVDRLIGAEIPSSGVYDPRTLLTGFKNDCGDWLPGFFDYDSFKETLCGWAQGIIVGRARLGGIPLGVIAVETRVTEQVIAADPASENSIEQNVVEAGQVWYPNSAYKTAQAINDFNYGEQLPLIIFANWRGFSGGQSDMYKEILKYGSNIVDALRAYRQPVFVYIIGELRGGAWVVLDPTINPDMMEMYAEENSRGGVLEPEGLVEIKYRRPQIISTMERLDPLYSTLKKQNYSNEVPPETKSEIQLKFENREKILLPIYNQISVQFADLHDRPGRMLAKSTISGIISWSESRKFFYWRLLRRISEESMVKDILGADKSMERLVAMSLVKKWYFSDVMAVRGGGILDIEEENDDERQGQDDIQFVRWINMRKAQNIARIEGVRKEALTNKFSSLFTNSFAFESFSEAAKTMDKKMREKMMESLRNSVE